MSSKGQRTVPAGVALDIDNVWKRYRVNTHDRPQTLKSALVNRFAYWRRGEAYWALQGVSVQIPQGQSVGLIGNNGAGKSTLFRIMCGLSQPTRGSIAHAGRVGSLLELGAGFNLEFSGRENAITGSILAGLTRAEAEARLPEVIAFAELEDFIDAPLRTYSNGMFVRLAFATEISLDPDILLIDEVLAVGDIAFQRKCLDYLSQKRAQGKTILVVSHSMEQILGLCDQAIWLEHGKIREIGSAPDVVSAYKSRIFGVASHIAGPTAPRLAERTGDVPVTLDSAVFINNAGDVIDSIGLGDPLIIRITFTAAISLQAPIFQLEIYDARGIKCIELNTDDDGFHLNQVIGETGLVVAFASVSLVPGTYQVNAGIYSSDWETVYAYHAAIANLHITGNVSTHGVVYVAHQWSMPASAVSEDTPVMANGVAE